MEIDDSLGDNSSLLDTVEKHIENKDIKAINSLFPNPGSLNYDLQILNALALKMSTDDEPPTNFYAQLLRFSVIRGWNLTVTHLLNNVQAVSSDEFRRSAGFWYVIHSLLNKNTKKDEKWLELHGDSITDDNLFDALEEVELLLTMETEDFVYFPSLFGIENCIDCPRLLKILFIKQVVEICRYINRKKCKNRLCYCDRFLP